MPPSAENTARTGLARALSKLGWCSRSQGVLLVREGKVTLNGRVCRDPEKPVRLGHDDIQVAGQAVEKAALIHLMLNKPRGLVTTASDEQGRETIFKCLEGHDLPHLGAVGRLDKASEGLLLLTNDTTWAARITDPASHLEKTYHVQVSVQVDEPILARLSGVVMDEGESLRLLNVKILRHGEKNTWLEITLDEGRNRHIRRVMQAHGLEVLRLVRVAIGDLELGPLVKGEWRHLTPDEVRRLGK